MGDPMREAWAELARTSDRWQAHHPVRFYAGAWAFGFLAAFVSVWLAGETNVFYPAMTGTGLVLGLAVGARLRRPRDRQGAECDEGGPPPWHAPACQQSWCGRRSRR